MRCKNIDLFFYYYNFGGSRKKVKNMTVQRQINYLIQMHVPLSRVSF